MVEFNDYNAKRRDATLNSTLLMIGMGGVMMLIGNSQNLEGLIHLGYPTYLAKILGVAKVEVKAFEGAAFAAPSRPMGPRA